MKALAVLLALVATAAAAKPAYDGPDRRPFRIALAMTDDKTSPYTRAVKRGIMLAAEELTRTQGLTFDFLQYDTADSAEHTAQVMRRVTQARPDLVIGDINASQTVVGAAAAEKAGLVYVTTTGASAEITRGRRYVFRTCFSDAHYADVMSDWLAREGGRSFVIVYDSARLYGASEKEQLKGTFERRGSVLAVQALNRLTTFYDDHIAEVARLKPDVLFLGTEQTQTLLYLAKLKAAHLKDFTLIGTSRFANEGIHAALKKLNVPFPIVWLANAPLALERGPRYGRVAAEFKRRYGDTMNALGAVGFDTLMLFGEAVRGKAHVTQAELADALRNVSGYEGLSGDFAFAGGQDVIKTTYLRRRDAGGRITTWVVPPRPTGGGYAFRREDEAPVAH